MNTKSTIQLIAEQIEVKNKFFEHLSELCEKYTIENNVFVCNKDGNAQELKEGYYGEVKEYDSIKDLREDFNPYLQGIRVVGDKFHIGNLYSHLTDVKEDCVYDLKAAQKIMIL